MKLITESTFDVTTSSVLNEASGKKQWFIEGCFMQHSTPNRNKRIYPEHVLDREYNRYQKIIQAGRAIGETNHPDYLEPDPTKASHRVVEMTKDGKNYHAKSLILPTPEGKIVMGLMEGGYNAGVSTRGVGTIKSTNEGVSTVNNDYHLSCIDIVHNPSGIDCWVNGILEGVEFIYENGSYIQRIAEDSKNEILKMKNINEEKLVNAFNRFINQVRKCD